MATSATELLSEKYEGFKDANASATTAKTWVVMNGMVVLPLNSEDAAADNYFVYECDRVNVAKASGAWTVGQEIFFDSGNSNFTTTASGNAFAGYAVEDATSGATFGVIHLTPHTVYRNVPYDAGFTIGAESSNAIIVSVQLKDKVGADIAAIAGITGYLSSDSAGGTLEPHSATLTVAASTDGVVIPHAAANAAGHTVFTMVSESDGDVDVSITQTSGADTMYLNLIMPNGKIITSGAITFAA